MVRNIFQRLLLEGSPRKVQRTLESIVAEGEEFDSKVGSARGGRKRKLSTIECEIAADQLRQGLGLSQTTYSKNVMRLGQSMRKVGKTTLRDSVRAVVKVVVARTVKLPTGKKDVDSPWATVRLAQATQYTELLARGKRSATRLAGGSPLELAQIS